MPGPLVFTVDEVQALVPRLEAIFAEVEGEKENLRRAHLRIGALELIWGTKVQEPACADHLEYVGHHEELKRAQEHIEALTSRVQSLGGHVKSVEPPLVDFYGVRERRLVFWCWTRGESVVDHWHHVDEGFTGRQRV
jgi:hypothetical protein